MLLAVGRNCLGGTLHPDVDEEHYRRHHAQGREDDAAHYYPCLLSHLFIYPSDITPQIHGPRVGALKVIFMSGFK